MNKQLKRNLNNDIDLTPEEQYQEGKLPIINHIVKNISRIMNEKAEMKIQQMKADNKSKQTFILKL